MTIAIPTVQIYEEMQRRIVLRIDIIIYIDIEYIIEFY